eukprot:PhF_6_TR5741/c0_g1_i1/m.8465/K07942/ARL1; ADP-ribosylation factor-like protein 1
MGNFLASQGWMKDRLNSFLSYFQKSPARIVLLGLDDAGKTTLLRRISLLASGKPWTPEDETTLPTIGFNTEMIQLNGILIEAWDLGGQTTIRPMWRFYYSECKAIVFVVDSVDKERMPTVARELHAVLREPELSGVPLLVVANKTDLMCACPISEISDECSLHMIGDRTWTIVPISALQGTGIEHAVNILSKMLQ